MAKFVLVLVAMAIIQLVNEIKPLALNLVYNASIFYRILQLEQDCYLKSKTVE